jgi:hypothetical protein
MKAQTQFFTAAAATAIAGLVSAAPAQAFSFGNAWISVKENTRVQFDFLESHGDYTSTFGIYNKTTGNKTSLFAELPYGGGSDAGGKLDHMGTCGITVLNCSQYFTFEVDNEYAFYLESLDRPNDILYSVDDMNRAPAYSTQTKFFSDPAAVLADDSFRNKNVGIRQTHTLHTSAGENSNLSDGPVLIAFEDSGRLGDHDFNDFLVEAKVSVPEPATLAGLGLVAGAMALSRRRQTDKTS